MQFTNVKSKEKDYDIYLKSEKLVHSEKNFPAIWKWKKLVPSYFEPDKHCCSYLEREKSGSLLFGDQKMQFTTVRSKEKDYDIYLKSEKLVHSQQFPSTKKMFPSYLKVKKTGSQLFSYFEPDKHCCSYLEREKSGSLLFGDLKMQFTTVRSQEKDYDIYLKSEKLVHSLQEHEKYVSQLFGIGKNWILAISSLTITVAAIWREKKVDPCYLRPKNVVHNCQVQGKRL